MCVIDSVQTLHASELTGAPGSVGQVREVASRIMQVAKAHAIAVLLVGHVTKEGSLAGPRVLEHLVDCVLQFEGERERTYRTLRALKNRFGSTNECGVFEMRSGGLVEVLDASARFVGEATRAPGSVVLAAMEGTRPLLVEVQALVSPSELVPPRRVVNGIDRNRLALVLAVLGRHAGVAVGIGRRVRQRRRRRPRRRAGRRPGGRARRRERVEGDRGGRDEGPLAAFGEIGLTGELRSVAHADRRHEEAAKFGLGRVLGPPGDGGRKSGRSARRSAPRSAAATGAAPPRPRSPQRVPRDQRVMSRSTLPDMRASRAAPGAPPWTWWYGCCAMPLPRRE